MRPASGTAAVFGRTTYRELIQDAEAEGQAWRTGFLQAAADLLDAADRAAASGDRPALKSAAHLLAGSALSVGAAGLGTAPALRTDDTADKADATVGA